MRELENVKPETIITDIAVLGGGGAGLAAAVAAAEKGANCLVLEKRRKLGGNSAMAEGFFAAESPAQKRMMIDANRDVLFNMAMDYAHWTLNPRIIRAFIDKSGDTVRWLESKGMRFERIPPLYPNQVPLVWHCPDKGGNAVVRLLIRECQEMGIKLLCETPARKILISKTGEVTGVLAKKKESEIVIAAKCVIVATGGYGGNKQLIRKYYPNYTEVMKCHGLPHMGDGLKMATEIGAATEGLGILHSAGPFVGGSLKGSVNVSALAAEPQTLWVNKRGERFTNEATSFHFFECVNAMLRQPDKISYTLFDESIKRSIIENGMIKGMGLGGGFTVRIKELEKDLQKQVDRGKVKISNSWDDIAGFIGAKPEVLESTIEDYNACCDRGYDPVFAKNRRYLIEIRTPPFYSIKCNPAFLGTIGGIKINHNMQVLNQQGDEISGLYAIGVDTGGWESETYNAHLSGSTFGFALNSGRIAGENAAKMVVGK